MSSLSGLFCGHILQWFIRFAALFSISSFASTVYIGHPFMLDLARLKCISCYHVHIDICSSLNATTEGRNNSTSTNLSAILTKVVPLCLIYASLSDNPNFILLSYILSKLVYSSMVFALELAYRQASTKMNNISNWANFVENGTAKVKIHSFDDAMYMEHNGSTL